MADDAVEPDRPREAERVSTTSAGGDADSIAGSDPSYDEEPGFSFGLNLSFRTRLTVGLIAAAVLPLAAFGIIVLLTGSAASGGETLGRILLFTIVTAALVGVLLAYLLAADLIGPLRAIAAAVDRVSAGDLSTPIAVPGEDELARLADSHNRLAATLERRNRELGRILAAIESASPRDGPEFLAGRAATDARSAFGMIDCRILLVDPATFPGRGTDSGRVASGAGRPPVRCGGAGRARRTPARNSPLGASRPGPAGAVCERDRRRDPECAAVRHRRGPEHPAARARRRQGRLPPRRQPQPPNPTDQHPRLRPPAPERSPRPATGDHRRAVGSPQPDGPPAAHRDPPRIRRAPPARARSSRSRPASSGHGRRSRSRASSCASRTSRSAGSPSPIRTSSTRSSGHSSTTR